jgi:hypothetical protein
MPLSAESFFGTLSLRFNQKIQAVKLSRDAILNTCIGVGAQVYLEKSSHQAQPQCVLYFHIGVGVQF